MADNQENTAPPVRPLDGLTALELADAKVSFCGKLLADLGARVLLIEPPGSDHAGVGRALLHAGKRSLTLDLAQPQGRQIFLSLVARASVVLEGFPPGRLAGWQLDHAALGEHNPRVILVSITGFGQEGPHRDWSSCDLAAAALGGWTWLSGEPGRAPLPPPGRQAYKLAGLHGAVGVLLALRLSRLSGQGEHLDISLQECVASCLDHALPRYLDSGEIPQRTGGAHWNQAFYVLPCRDGHIHLAPFQQWETLVEWMDSEGLAEDLGDAKYLDPGHRLANLEHILAVLGRWTRAHGKQELFDMASLMRFTWAPVCTPEEVLASPQLAERGFWQNLPLGKGETVQAPGPPYRCDDQSASPLPAAPAPGQDNQAVLGRELGLSAGELTELADLGII